MATALFSHNVRAHSSLVRCAKVELRGGHCCCAGVPNVRKKGLSGADGGGKGSDESRASPDVFGADIIGGFYFASYCGFAFLPHVPQVVAQYRFHIFLFHTEK